MRNNGIKILENVPLATYSTFGLGGRSRFFVSVGSIKELNQVLSKAETSQWQWRLIGGGSNILFVDQDYSGLTIKNDIRGVEYSQTGGRVRVRAAAGEVWDELVSWSTRQGWFGLENLSGIPGSVGAAPVQNIGAYGVELKDLVLEVEVLDLRTGRLQRLSADECRFGYRWSFFKEPIGQRFVVTAVVLQLEESGSLVTHYPDVAGRVSDLSEADLTPQRLREIILDIRSRKFPDLDRSGTAGSFFTNPVISKKQFEDLHKHYPGLPSYPVSDERVKVSAAWILDKVCKLKGYRQGKVGLFEKQPLVVVAEPGATAQEVKDLASFVQAKVQQLTGLELSWEVTEM